MTSKPVGCHRLLSVVLAVSASIATRGPAQSWTRAPVATHPSARFVPAMAELPSGTQLLLYGGSSNLSTPLADTWSFDGTTWTRWSPGASPTPAMASRMACDTGRGRLVLFGGVGPNFTTLDQTWEWTGTTWQQRNVQPRPPARAFQGMAYDPVRRVTVMYGGADFSFGIRRLGDTWEWNGTAWRQAQPMISPRRMSDMAMAFSPALGKVVLHGGNAGGGNYLSETWLYDGSTWAKYDPPAAGPVVTAGAMVSHGPTGGVVLFGGARPPDGATDETWLLHPDRGWVLFHTPAAPSRRTDLGAAYLGGAGGVDRLVVFGGGLANQSAVDDTWMFGGDDASFASIGVGCGATGATPTLRPAAGSVPKIGGTLSVEVSGLDAAVQAGQMLASLTSNPVVVSLAFLGLPTCHGYTDLRTGLFALPFAVSNGAASWHLGVPPDPALAGVELSLQAVCLDPGSPLLLPLVLSNGAIARCGI